MKQTDDDQRHDEPLPASGETYPPGYTVVHTLKQLREAKGPIWVSCMTLLLQEIEQAEKLGGAKREIGMPGDSSPLEF